MTGNTLPPAGSAAIYFHPEAYTTSGPKLMGRNAAGESFLRGYLAHGRAETFWAQVQQASHAQAFGRVVAEAGRSEPVRAVDKNNLAALSQIGAVYYPGPGIGQYAWQRAAFGHGAWSLCGITHTTASAGAMDAITDLLTAPVQPWDAVICTSTAVKDNVTRVLQAQAEYLELRMGITKLVLPQMPVIPLGIHVDDFIYDNGKKATARAAIGADDRSHVVLFVGRLSFHAKAHPLAMYQALERAAKSLTGDEKVILVECGWHANEHIANAYADAAHIACPSVRVVTLDGRKAEDRATAWASADVFCSLSDNVQETFGIVPIEAMAAGLPVIVSDWDGYKDTVRDGIDGFRIPTVMPAPGLGGDLALRHSLEIDTYDMYCGHGCSLVAVDVDATANALTHLLRAPEVRKQMGDAGRRRARELYDWSMIIPQYEALWGRLAQIRKTDALNLRSPAHAWPARMDPFAAFSAYPTATLTMQTVLQLADEDSAAALARFETCWQLAMVNFARAILPAKEEIRIVLNAAGEGARPALELVRDIAPERQALVFRSLVWLLKLGVLKTCS